MRILVIEDEPEIRELLRKTLEQECYAVDTASDGEQGSIYVKINEYDLIILDNILPMKDGIDICREMRAAGKTTPILMVSVKSEVMTKVDLLNAGADDYLTKPFSIQELLARVRALLRRPQVVQGEVLEMDDLVLDTKKHLVTRDGEEIYLTRKEFMLLEYLMRSPGVVLSRGMIMEHVWDMNADPFSNTIESHIMSLRRKIGKNGGNKLIHTVSGRGYKLSKS